MALDMSKNSSYRAQFDVKSKKAKEEDFKINY